MIRRISILSFLLFTRGLILSAAYTFRLISNTLSSNFQIPCKTELKDNIVILSLRMLCLLRIFAGQFFYISFFVIFENYTPLILRSLRYIIVGVSFFVYLNSKNSWFKSSLFSFRENTNKNLFSFLHYLNESKTTFSPLFLIKTPMMTSINLNIGK